MRAPTRTVPSVTGARAQAGMAACRHGGSSRRRDPASPTASSPVGISIARSPGSSAARRPLRRPPISRARNTSSSASPLAVNASVRFNRSVGRPRLGLPAGEHERLGRPLARERDPGVDAAHERVGDRLRVRPVARPLRARSPRYCIRRVIASRSMKFGPSTSRQPALRRSPPQIHLKQPVLRLHEPLREEQIVRDSPRRCAARPRCRGRSAPARSDRRRRACPRPARRAAARGVARPRATGRAGRSAETDPHRRRTADDAQCAQRRSRRDCGCSLDSARMAIKDALLADYDHEMGTTRQAARAAARRQAGVEAAREIDVARRAGDASDATSRTGPAPSSTSRSSISPRRRRPADEHTSRAAILAAFDATRARTRAWMDKTDGEYTSLWTLKRGGQQIFSVPRVAGFPNLRAAPHHPSSRPVERLPAAERRRRPGDLRTVGRRRLVSIQSTAS